VQADASTDDTEPGTGHLDIQELAAAAGPIKIRIQKARAAVKELPDMDRSIAEQEEEIAELKNRIAKMRDMLKGLGKDGDWMGNSNWLLLDKTHPLRPLALRPRIYFSERIFVALQQYLATPEDELWRLFMLLRRRETGDCSDNFAKARA
jgi:hypothetical protein